MPFAKTLGVVFDRAAKDEVRGHLAWAPELCTSGGLLHGGVLMSLADNTGALCRVPEPARGRGHNHH